MSRPRSESPAVNTPSEPITPRTHPHPVQRRQASDDIEELALQLERELGRLEGTDQASGDLTDAFQLAHTYLHHGQRLTWNRVVHGDFEAPRKLLDAFGETRAFADFHAPELSPVQTVATTINATLGALILAEQALADARNRQRLANRDLSKREHEVLRVLLSSTAYLRRKQVFDRMDEGIRPTLSRVGQILVELHEMGFVSCRHERAQGDPDAAFYAINERGQETARRIFVNLPKVVRDAVRSRIDEDRDIPVSENFFKTNILAGVVASCSLRDGKGDLAVVRDLAGNGQFALSQALYLAIQLAPRLRGKVYRPRTRIPAHAA